MAKIRVYELAKELNIDSKEIVDFLGNDIKSASGLEETEADRVRAKFAVKPADSGAKDAVKAEKKPVEDKASVPVKKAEAENAAKPEKKAEAAAEQQDVNKEAPKKKKPVLLFRPENSSFQSKGAKPQQNNRSRDRRNDDRRPNRNRQNQDGDMGGSLRQRTMIKPSVPTTAEMYKDNRRDDELRQAAKKQAAEAAAAAAAQAKEESRQAQAAPVTEEVRETAVQTENIQTEAKTAAVVSENSGSVRTPVSAETKPADRPQRTDDQRRRPYTDGRSGDNRGFDRNRQGGQGGNAQGQNRRPQGQGQNQSGNGRPGSQNRDGRAPFQRNQDGRPAGRGQGGRPGQGSGASGGASGGFQKPADNRSVNKKNNVHEKTRNDRDKTGKKAENFKNLSKTPLRRQEEKKEEQIKMIVIPETITIKDLAEKMKQKPADLIKKLFLQGKMMTVNTEIPYEEAEEIALEYNILAEQEVKVDVIEELLKEEEEDEALMSKRPPVVCVMGHVDHGKTSLLDAIRKTNVTAREAGGITQHIGAYMVECNGEKITFLDTPGHEAFTAMRMRGAQATDIAILVVAADDGVMPQTVEAINHAKAAGVDVIVAVNKIDKPTANIDRVKQEMTEYGLIAEDWGGDTVFVPVSAKTGEGIDSLLEMVLLVTEVKELKANPNREMRGIVIEAKLDKGRGPVATVLVQKGTMKVGDFVSAGSFYGRVRAMLDANGENMKAASPSTPVEILGLNGVPNAGEVCIGHKNEKSAREYADTFIAEHKKEMLAETKARLTMDSLFAEIKAGNIKELPIIVKADVQGSVEAVRASLEKLSNDEVAVKVIHGGVGLINESDISLASASNAIVIGFNVKPDPQAKQLAESENVDLRLYRVIYQAIDDVEAAMKGMLAPVYEEKVLGHAEVRQTFKASGIGVIAGCYVLDGTFERGTQARITRGKDQIFEGNIASLKRFKDDVKEVREGYECGIVFEKFNDLMEGDIIEGYKMVQVERT